MGKINLQSSDGEIFLVDMAVARQSVTIRTMVEDLDIGENDQAAPLPNVNAAILKKVKFMLNNRFEITNYWIIFIL